MRWIFTSLLALALCAGLSGCSRSESDQLTSEQQSTITTAQEKLNNLKVKIDNAMADAKSTGSDAAKQAADDLRAAWDNAEDKLSQLKKTSSAEWDRQKESLENAMGNLSAKLKDWADRAKSSVTPATNPSATTAPTEPSNEPILPTR